jgi:transposase
MAITAEQYARIEPHLPTQRGNVSHENLNVINAILFVAENGCKWRALPKRFGNWHTIYTRMNRWAKAGVLDRLFAELQREQLIRIKIEAVSLDSTIVKDHPDGTGALKKRPPSDRQIPRRLEHKSSYGCRECSMRHRLLALTRTGRRCSRGPRAVALAPRRSGAPGLLPPVDGLRIGRQ